MRDLPVDFERVFVHFVALLVTFERCAGPIQITDKLKGSLEGENDVSIP